MEEQNEVIQEPLDLEQQNSLEPKNQKQFDPKEKKKISTLSTVSAVLLVVSLFSAVFVTYTFASNMDLFNTHNLSVILVIFTIPLFLICAVTELSLAGPAFVISLTTIIKFRLKNPILIIVTVLSAISFLYPIVLFIILLNWRSTGGGTSSSSISEEVSSIMFLLESISLLK